MGADLEFMRVELKLIRAKIELIILGLYLIELEFELLGVHIYSCLGVYI